MTSSDIPFIRIGRFLVIHAGRQRTGFFDISDPDLIDTGNSLVINRYEPLVDLKVLEERSLRVSIRDLLEFGVMEECVNIACIR
jgi:hypothetical protein